MTYDRTLADRFWHALWGKSETDKRSWANPCNTLPSRTSCGARISCSPKKKADPNTGDGFCVRWAAEGGHSEMIRLLARHGADMNAKNGEALVRAARHGHVATAKTLLENGADASRPGFRRAAPCRRRKRFSLHPHALNSGQDFTAVATELMDAAGGIGQFDKAGLYMQYLDAKTRPSAGAAFRPPKP